MDLVSTNIRLGAPPGKCVAVGKTQDLRTVDIALLGPFMIWFGARAQEMPDWARAVLVLSGAATIGYNLRNYITERELEELYVPPPR